MFYGMSSVELREVFRALRETPHGLNKQVRLIAWAGVPLVELAGRSEEQAARIVAAWRKSGVLIPGEPVKASNRSDIATVAVDPIQAAKILSDYTTPGHPGE